MKKVFLVILCLLLIWGGVALFRDWIVYKCAMCGTLRFDKFASYVISGYEGSICEECRDSLVRYGGFLK